LRTVPKAPDLTQAQATVQAASQKAGAYLSSWGAWASEKRRSGWGRSASGSANNSAPPSPTLDQKEFSRPPTSVPQVLFQAQPESPPKAIVQKQPNTEQGWSTQAVSGAETKVELSGTDVVSKPVETSTVKVVATEKSEAADIPKVTISAAEPGTGQTNKAEITRPEVGSITSSNDPKDKA
jgi:hypothetical protein